MPLGTDARTQLLLLLGYRCDGAFGPFRTLPSQLGTIDGFDSDSSKYLKKGGLPGQFYTL